MSMTVRVELTRSFLGRHHGVAVACGWLIILGTFIVKDVLRDSARDVADSINAAETLYLLRDDDLELHQEIDDVDAHLAQTETDILKFDGKRPVRERHKQEWSTQFGRDSQRVVRIVTEVGLEMDNLLRLADKAQPAPEHMKELANLYKEGDALKMRMLKEEAIEIQIPLEQFDPKASDRVSVKRYYELWSFGQRLHIVGAMVLDDAHETKERKERLVRIFTPISIVLWVLGFFLTVSSKVFGVEGVSSVE